MSTYINLLYMYDSRSVLKDLKDRGIKDVDKEVFLKSDTSWQDKYKEGTFRDKRMKMFREIEGIFQ